MSCRQLNSAAGVGFSYTLESLPKNYIENQYIKVLARRLLVKGAV